MSSKNTYYYFRLYVSYFMNVISIIVNAQNHNRLKKDSQTLIQAFCKRTSSTFNAHPPGHHSSFRNEEKTLSTKLFFGRNKILEVALEGVTQEVFLRRSHVKCSTKKVFLKIVQN